LPDCSQLLGDATLYLKGMTRDFPQLLVASEFAPNASGGGPAVVRQMLRDWPADRLHWWSCLPDDHARFGRTVGSHHVAKIPRRLFPHIRVSQLKSWILDKTWVPWAEKHLRHTMAELQPDVVWVIPHQWSIPPLTKILPGSNVAYHVSMQDYPDGKRSRATFGNARCQRWMSAAEALYHSATTCDATSHPMIDDLFRRTGRKADQMLHAGLEELDFERLNAPREQQDSVIRIAYAGTIMAEGAFTAFVSVLKDLRGDAPQPVELHFFSAHTYRERPWFDASWMIEHGNLSEVALLDSLRKCTWGFSPMDLTDHDPQYNRVSFPTKFISYLAAGLPVFTLGHPQSSVVKMAETYQVGLCLTSADKRVLREKTGEGLEIQNPGKIFGKEILRCARNEFDATTKRQTLYQCLFKSAGWTKRESSMAHQQIDQG
jgi:hypothetical protein